MRLFFMQSKRLYNTRMKHSNSGMDVTAIIAVRIFCRSKGVTSFQLSLPRGLSDVCLFQCEKGSCSVQEKHINAIGKLEPSASQMLALEHAETFFLRVVYQLRKPIRRGTN